ncbi:exonuclease domain-containing protein [Mesobacillus maritimus]|uniref:3'-5' exonuclease n=1 Tax=Mesobacillus maritimus TaxID=1643336 RepID=A0ABS7K9M2_9BACI|nr:exonuclease domain-containing protein [Mesobacillus maritimus]MBY0098918.1 3'-5' exonuclease [Mesobacillus maritimus]
MGMNDFIQFFRGMGTKKIGSNVLAGHGHSNAQSISFLRQLEKEVRKKDDLSSPLNLLEVVVFDIETTGFFPEKGDEIISIGAVKMKGSEVLTQETYYSLIRSKKPVPPEITSLTNIHDDDLRSAPEIAEVLMSFLRFTSTRILIAHHSKHEQSFMQKATWEHTRTKFQHRIIDTSFLTRIFDPSSGSQPLEKICLDCGIEIKDRHNALGDALMTAELWGHYLKKAEAEGFTTLGEVYEYLAKIR